MNNRERILAILNYKKYDRMPLLHFGYWRETLLKWANEGHISVDQAKSWGDGNPTDDEITNLLGFDSNWARTFNPGVYLDPGFEHKVIKTLPDGSRHERNGHGVTILVKNDTVSIPAEIEHLLVDRASWEKHYKHRFQYSESRVKRGGVNVNGKTVKAGEGGLDYLKTGERDCFYGIYCGSMIGHLRDIVGVVGLSYLIADDRELVDEMVETIGDLAYRCIKEALETGAKFDFAHFWEDICFKNGPLVSPRFFKTKICPQYERITSLLKEYGINIVTVDCDGKIDALVGHWLSSGVNTMFPIEVGTWDASIAPWRAQYGKELRGVGGMNKVVFSRDRAAIDAEIERLKPLMDLGGFIPCPDHRIAPDGKWDLVKYYCDKMRTLK